MSRSVWLKFSNEHGGMGTLKMRTMRKRKNAAPARDCLEWTMVMNKTFRVHVYECQISPNFNPWSSMPPITERDWGRAGSRSFVEVPWCLRLFFVRCVLYFNVLRMVSLWITWASQTYPRGWRCRTKCKSWCQYFQCRQFLHPCSCFLWRMSLWCWSARKVVRDCIRVLCCHYCSSNLVKNFGKIFRFCAPTPNTPVQRVVPAGRKTSKSPLDKTKYRCMCLAQCWR